MPGVPHQAANDGLPWPIGQDGHLKRHGYPKRHRWGFLVANEHTSRCSFNGVKLSAWVTDGSSPLEYWWPVPDSV